MERPAKRLQQAGTGISPRALLAGAVAAAGCLFLGFAQARASPPVDYLALTMWAVALAGTVAATYQARSVLMATGVLPVCIIAFLVGGWLPYKLELWDLTIHDFGSDDQPGDAALGLSLLFGTPFAIVLGFVIGFVTRVVRLNWIEARPRPRDAVR